MEASASCAKVRCAPFEKVATNEPPSCRLTPVTVAACTPSCVDPVVVEALAYWVFNGLPVLSNKFQLILRSAAPSDNPPVVVTLTGAPAAGLVKTPPVLKVREPVVREVGVPAVPPVTSSPGMVTL